MVVQKKRKPTKSKASLPAATWQVQTAKARLSEVIRRARTSGPQFVTSHGRDEVVIIGAEDFKKLTRRANQPDRLVQFFAQSPLAESSIDMERRKDFGRKVDL
jgi:antitoxin Phd